MRLSVKPVVRLFEHQGASWLKAVIQLPLPRIKGGARWASVCPFLISIQFPKLGIKHGVRRARLPWQRPFRLAGALERLGAVIMWGS